MHKRTATLRRPLAVDLDRLYEIHRAALGPYVEATWGWDEEWQAGYFREHFDPATLHVIESGGRAIGFLDVRAQADAVILQNIEIAPEYQGRGIGTELISDVLVAADSKRVPVRLQVLKANHRARELYRRLGFKVIGETENHDQVERLPVMPELC